MQDDIIRLIVSKQPFSLHHEKFASVCTDWYRITRDVWEPFQDKYPWLLLPCDYESQTCMLYSVFKSKKYQYDLPELKDKYVCGSSNGWIVLLDEDLRFNLINPVNRMKIHLPKPYDSNELTHLEDRPFESFNHYYKLSLCGKLIISQDHTMVASIIDDFSRLVVCRPRDDSWTLIGDVRYNYVGCSHEHFIDVVFIEKNLYACNDREVLVVHCSEVDIKTRSIRKPVQARFKLPSLSIYLVEYCGKLLFVLRNRNQLLETISFEIYILDEDTEKWSRMYGLGDKSLFLGRNGSISVCAQEIVECRPNCVYFVNDDYHGFDEDDFQFDNGVFCFNDNSVEEFNISHSDSSELSYWSTTPIWFQPKI